MISNSRAKINSIGASLLFLASQSNASIVRTYHFPPNTPITIQNPLYWELDTHCKIITHDFSNELHGMMIHKTGKINGAHLEQGQNISITVHADDDLHLVADYKAVLKITNYGESTVAAECRI